ncbi:MAG: OB-fold nucleic acid binding domain-containing protein, partial [Adhaeribacter sp.]
IYKFNVNQEGAIRFGLGAIKGTGEAAVESILEERAKNGPYQDIFDFAKRVNLRAVNKKTFESMAQAGAFDSFEKYHRAQYLDLAEGETQNLIEKAVRFGNNHQAEASAAQQSLFGGGAAVAAPLPKVPEVAPWTPTEKLRREKEVVGFYISGHPLDQFSLEIDSYCTCSLDKVTEYKGKDVNVAGIVSNVVIRTSAKNGNPFALFTLEDYDSTLNMALFGEDFVKFAQYLREGMFVFIKGKVQLRYKTEDQWELKPVNIQLLGDLTDKMANGVRLDIDIRTLNDLLIDRIEEAAQTSPGGKKFELMLTDPNERISIEMFSRKYRIDPKTFIQKIKENNIGTCKLL